MTWTVFLGERYKSNAGFLLHLFESIFKITLLNYQISCFNIVGKSLKMKYGLKDFHVKVGLYEVIFVVEKV